MPQVGETRSANGETRQWSGSRWEPVGAAQGAASQVEMHHPSAWESPLEAGAGELLRTGKEAAIGLARSPIDLLKGTLGMITHPIDTVSNAASALAHPVDTFNTLGDNPREAGSALGQILLGKFGVPEVAPRVPGAVSAAGRGLETAGTALADSKIGGFGVPGLGAAEAVLRGDPKGLAVAAAPYAMKYGGKGLQAAGRGLEGLKNWATAPATEPELESAGPNFRQLSPAAQARNVAATNDVDAGFSPAVAGKMNDIPGAGQSRAAATPKGGRISHLPQIPEQSVEEILAGLHEAAPKMPSLGMQATAEPSITPFTQEKYGIDPSIFGGDRTVGPMEPGPLVQPPEMGAANVDAMRQSSLAMLQKALDEIRQTQKPMAGLTNPLGR